jgi:hypothetical protein
MPELPIGDESGALTVGDLFQLYTFMGPAERRAPPLETDTGIASSSNRRSCYGRRTPGRMVTTIRRIPETSWRTRHAEWDAHDFMAKLSAATTATISYKAMSSMPALTRWTTTGECVDYTQLAKEYGQEGGEEARRYTSPAYRRREDQHLRQPRRGPDLHLACRAGQLEATRPPAPDDPPVERLQPQAGQPARGPGASDGCTEHPHDPAMAAGITRKPWAMADLVAAAQEADLRDATDAS